LETPPPPDERVPLTRARILRAGVDLADARGLERLSMRTLAGALGVEAMSLYNHVANKDDLLDGMVDLVMAEIESPRPDAPWRPPCDGAPSRRARVRAPPVGAGAGGHARRAPVPGGSRASTPRSAAFAAPASRTR
jgi:AcrR family transcriptional regulator